MSKTASADLKERVALALRQGHFGGQNDLVDVSDGGAGDVHVVVVSRKFDGLSTDEKSDLIWQDLFGKLRKSEWGRVSLSIGKSLEDIKAGF